MPDLRPAFSPAAEAYLADKRIVIADDGSGCTMKFPGGNSLSWYTSGGCELARRCVEGVAGMGGSHQSLELYLGSALGQRDLPGRAELLLRIEEIERRILAAGL